MGWVLARVEREERCIQGLGVDVRRKEKDCDGRVWTGSFCMKTGTGCGL